MNSMKIREVASKYSKILNEKIMKTLQAKLPDKVYEEIKTLIESGWFHDEKDVVAEALRRFLEIHKPELMEKFLMEDIEWGLSGKD